MPTHERTLPRHSFQEKPLQNHTAAIGLRLLQHSITPNMTFHIDPALALLRAESFAA